MSMITWSHSMHNEGKRDIKFAYKWILILFSPLIYHSIDEFHRYSAQYVRQHLRYTQNELSNIHLVTFNHTLFIRMSVTKRRKKNDQNTTKRWKKRRNKVFGRVRETTSSWNIILDNKHISCHNNHRRKRVLLKWNYLNTSFTHVS